MKKVTKSLMTLALLALGVSSANAQEWAEVATQGWVHEWRTMAEQTDGAALEVDGAYKVYCRSAAEATEAGNMIKEGDNIAGWDSQFFITFGENNALNDGDKLKLTMSVKADAAQTGIGTQAHAAPGQYKYWQCIGNVDFTTDWTTFNGEATISGDAVGMYTIAFNLSNGSANTFYFKDIKVEVLKAEVITAWTDIVSNGDLEGVLNKNYFKTEQGIGGPFISNILPEIGVNGSRGIEVNASANPSDDWSTQFFIRLNKKLPAGTKYKVSFDYKATKAASGDTQAHGEPGGYIFWSAIGSPNFTTDWQTYEKEGTVSSDQSTAEKPMFSIAFNLAKEKDEPVTYYFDNIKFEVPEDVAATLEDTSDPDQAVWPDDEIFEVGETGWATVSFGYPVVFEDVDVDAFTAMYDSEENCVDILWTNEVAKGQAAIIEAPAGYYVAKIKNCPVDPDNDLIASDASVEGDGTIYVLANGSNGVGFYKLAAGEKVGEGKGYLKLVEEQEAAQAAREFIAIKGEATAIKAMERAIENGAVFNLAGQRVVKAQKGLYIQNGKKYIK